MNESVVIFDRIRENLHTHRKTDSYEVLANDSIRQTIRRSCYTLTTTMFAVASLYFFGGDTTKNFALVMPGEAEKRTGKRIMDRKLWRFARRGFFRAFSCGADYNEHVGAGKA